MRLVCPNCDAEYEVDASAIPLAGRDVQCSNCGHAWFQVHPEVEAADEIEAEQLARAAEVAAPPPPTVEASGEMPPPVAPVETEIVPEVPQPVAEMPTVAEPAAPEPAAPEPAPSRPSRSLDETVLAVLREEAEREAAARRAEAAVPPMAAPARPLKPAPIIETQTEMPLAPEQTAMAAAVKRIARLRGVEPEPAAPPPPPKSRRDMLPAIEEINSTLRATSDRTAEADQAIVDTMEDARPSGGFRRGFVLFVLLAVLIVVLYVVAPLIAARVPALAGIASAYMRAVDAARLWLDSELRALIGALRGLAGGQGG